MAELSNKIDFVLLVSVKMANPNGDPLNGNRPRIDTAVMVKLQLNVLSVKSVIVCRIWDILFLYSLMIAAMMALLL